MPVTRDIEYEQQHNVVFVRSDVYERPEVLMSLELHLNYQAQHMGVKQPPLVEVRAKRASKP